MTARFAEVFKGKTRDEWEAIFKGKDACVAPVLDLNEVEGHPHNQERELLVTIEDVLQPATAPRLSRTPGKATEPEGPRGANTREVLGEVGYTTEEIGTFLDKGVVE